MNVNSSTSNISDTLVSLAPTDLLNYRTERYDGGGFSASLSQFEPEDVSLLIRLYNSVKKRMICGFTCAMTQTMTCCESIS